MGGVAKTIGTLAGTAIGGPLLGAAVGGGLGAVKQNQQKGEFNRQKQLAADTARYSPWTGLNAMQYMPAQSPSAFENIGGGLIGGALQGNSWANAAKQNPMSGAQTMANGSGLGAAPAQAPSFFNPMGAQQKSPWSYIS